MFPAGTRARVPSGNIDSDAAWDLHVLGPGGLARWNAEAEARVREGACGAYASRTVVDLTSDRPPDPERDIVLWRDRLNRRTFDLVSPDFRARLSSALRRLAAPSAFAATRAVAAHSPYALDRRIDGTARRTRATRDETVDALAVSARRDRLKQRRRAREAAIFFAAAKSDASPASPRLSATLGDDDSPSLSDDASSLSSFAAADSDDGVASRERESATPTRSRRPSSFRSRRVPKAPPFPAPPRETARAFLWAEKRVDHPPVSTAWAETAELIDPASPRDALERVGGFAFFQTQRLDAATRPAAEAFRYANEPENAENVDADVYPAAASAAVARARSLFEATKNAVRRENREETARSRRAAAFAAEAARVARRRRELAGANVSRSAASFFRRRNEAAARKQTSSRARTANRGPVEKVQTKSAKRVERRDVRLSDDAAAETAPLPANALRILDLTWNPHVCWPDGVETADDASVFEPRLGKHPAILPYSPANAEACARAGDAASSRRLRDWCVYAGVPTRADATDGHRATCLKRAYLDALEAIETLAPGVSAAAAAVTAAETKARHAEARAKGKGMPKRFGDGKTTLKARQASARFLPRDEVLKFARRNPEWKT